MTKQKVVRVYPTGYGDNTLTYINGLLESGWCVKFITPLANNIHDYVIEKAEVPQ